MSRKFVVAWSKCLNPHTANVGMELEFERNSKEFNSMEELTFWVENGPEPLSEFSITCKAELPETIAGVRCTEYLFGIALRLAAGDFGSMTQLYKPGLVRDADFLHLCDFAERLRQETKH